MYRKYVFAFYLIMSIKKKLYNVNIDNDLDNE